VSRGWSVCGAERSEVRAGEHNMWYGDGRIGEAVRKGLGKEVGEEVGVREAGVPDV